jgi:hypothetical protein
MGTFQTFLTDFYDTLPRPGLLSAEVTFSAEKIQQKAGAVNAVLPLSPAECT